MASKRNNSKHSVFDTYIEDDTRQKQVSDVLKKYDLDGDGKLDDAEQQNIGHDILRMEDIARLQKKLLLFALGVIVFLCISNIATGYLAVILAKDTKVAEDGVMKDTSGGNVKTQAIAPKITVYEPLEQSNARRLESESINGTGIEDEGNLTGSVFQNKDIPNSISLQGLLDSEGVAAIQEGGLAHFMTESGMQACDVTSVTSLNETFFRLETSCGEGTLALVDHDDDHDGSGRRLSHSSNYAGVVEVGGCRDASIYCPYWVRQSWYCEDQVSASNCMVSCGLCPNFYRCEDYPFTFYTPFPSPGRSLTCRDVESMHMYLKAPYCSYGTVYSKCPKACGYCPGQCGDLYDPVYSTYCQSVSCAPGSPSNYFCGWTCGTCREVRNLLS